MRILIASGLTILACVPALAALPPQYQRQRELLAIITDDRVVDAFGFGGIEAVEFMEDDLYQVRGGDCVLEVRIENLPNTHGEGWAGPREFTTVVGEPQCQ